ncbi:hypothetical protein F5Y09DRAFT_354785 [Xylaria sp. FL1042]|nr:hypothetical protein F5Y09DRAFT_354785 [Xylaria sp. FL1042]
MAVCSRQSRQRALGEPYDTSHPSRWKAPVQLNNPTHSPRHQAPAQLYGSPWLSEQQLLVEPANISQSSQQQTPFQPEGPSYPPQQRALSEPDEIDWATLLSQQQAHPDPDWAALLQLLVEPNNPSELNQQQPLDQLNDSSELPQQQTPFDPNTLSELDTTLFVSDTLPESINFSLPVQQPAPAQVNDSSLPSQEQTFVEPDTVFGLDAPDDIATFLSSFPLFELDVNTLKPNIYFLLPGHQASVEPENSSQPSQRQAPIQLSNSSLPSQKQALVPLNDSPRPSQQEVLVEPTVFPLPSQQQQQEQVRVRPPLPLCVLEDIMAWSLLYVKHRTAQNPTCPALCTGKIPGLRVRLFNGNFPIPIILDLSENEPLDKVQLGAAQAELFVAFNGSWEQHCESRKSERHANSMMKLAICGARLTGFPQKEPVARDMFRHALALLEATGFHQRGWFEPETRRAPNPAVVAQLGGLVKHVLIAPALQHLSDLVRLWLDRPMPKRNFPITLTGSVMLYNAHLIMAREMPMAKQLNIKYETTERHISLEICYTLALMGNAAGSTRRSGWKFLTISSS